MLSYACCSGKIKTVSIQIKLLRHLVSNSGGIAVSDLCRELGISSATFYKRRAKYGGMRTSMMVRMKGLEEENRRPKRMCAEERMKVEIVAEALAKKWCHPGDESLR